MAHEIEHSASTSASSNTLQQGADLFFQAALEYGYRYVFGNPGTTEAAFMDALVRYPDLRFVLFLQEDGATGAADGFARLTGWPAIVNLHLAPGLANGLSNIHNAYRAQVPMLVTVGNHDTRHLIEDSPLAGDIEGLARTVCKWTWTVKDAGEMAAALYRATLIAMTPPQGPVCLILPTNTLTAPPRTVDGRIPEIPALQLPMLGQAPSSEIEHAVEMLLAARHPVLLVGDIESAAQKSVATLAALTGARIVYDIFPRRLEGEPLPDSSWLPYFPEERRALLAQADLLFLVGVSSFTTLFLYENNPAPVVAAGTRVIQLTDDITALGKNERGNLPLYGNVTTTFERLTTAIQERRDKAGQESEAEAQTPAPSQTEQKNTGDTGPLRPVALMQALRQVLPANTILVDEAITARQAMLQHVLNAATPVTSYLAVRGASIGGGLPVAVGAQLGAPHRPVVAVIGDGSAMYTIQVLWTAARYRLPLLAVICNNASYDIIKVEMLRLGGTLTSSDETTLQSLTSLDGPRLDFARLGEGMGVRGWTIRDRAELLPNLKAALETCASGAPALVDVQLSSIPVAFLKKR